MRLLHVNYIRNKTRLVAATGVSKDVPSTKTSGEDELHLY